MKYDLFFRLSFISYVLIMIVRSGKLWVDITLSLFILALVYQFIYIFFLRKKYNKKFSNVFLRFLLYGITSVSVYILVWYIDIFFNGYYTGGDVVGIGGSGPYYGIQAILKSDWEIYVSYVIFNLCIIIVYKLVNKKLKKQKSC